MNIEQEILNVEGNSQNMKKRKFDLEERLVDFGVLSIEVSENLHTTPAGRHIKNKNNTLVKGTSNFGIPYSISDI